MIIYSHPLRRGRTINHTSDECRDNGSLGLTAQFA